MLSHRMSVNVGVTKFTAKTLGIFSSLPFSHQNVKLKNIQVTYFWFQCTVCMNPAPKDMSCAQSLPAL